MTKLLLIPLSPFLAVAAAIILTLGIVLTALIAPVFESLILTNPPKFYEYGKE